MEKGTTNRRNVWASGVHQLNAENRRELGSGMDALEVLKKNGIPCRVGKGGSKIGGCVLIECRRNLQNRQKNLWCTNEVHIAHPIRKESVSTRGAPFCSLKFSKNSQAISPEW
jgi:hypothetical protein